MDKYKVNMTEKNFGSEESISKFAVAFVEYGDACDGFPGILGVYDTLAEAAQEMLADIYEYKNRGSGICTTKYTTVNGEVWFGEDKTNGCQWHVVEI